MGICGPAGTHALFILHVYSLATRGRVPIPLAARIISDALIFISSKRLEVY